MPWVVFEGHMKWDLMKELMESGVTQYGSTGAHSLFIIMHVHSNACFCYY